MAETSPSESLPLPVESQDVRKHQVFQFVRHALSCNNILTSLINITRKKFEPSITNYGIVKTSEFSYNDVNFKSDHVYVSNLLRTWVTAFLLYGVNTGKLNLYISPYLKEKHGTLKTGNYPEDAKITMNRFLNAMNMILRINSTYDYPSTVSLYFPPKNGEINPQLVTFNKDFTKDGIYVINSKEACSIEDSCGPKLSDPLKQTQFLTTGDLQKFMEWFSADNYHGVNLGVNGVVNVVTHSQVMQSYLKTQFNLQIDSEKAIDPVEIETAKEFGDVRHSNSWWFQVPEIIETSTPPIPNYLVKLDISGFSNSHDNYIPNLHKGVGNAETDKYLDDENKANKLNRSLCFSNEKSNLICSTEDDDYRPREQLTEEDKEYAKTALIEGNVGPPIPPTSRSFFSRVKSAFRSGGKKTKRTTKRKTKRKTKRTNQKSKQRKYKKSRK